MKTWVYFVTPLVLILVAVLLPLSWWGYTCMFMAGATFERAVSVWIAMRKARRRILGK